MRRALGALGVATLVLLAACGGDDSGADGDASDARPEAPADGPTGAAEGTVRYLSLGDSLSQGVGAPDEATGSFPALLAERWRDGGCTVEHLNAGISGYTASQIIADELPQLAPFEPTVITFQTGANDIVNGVTIDQYRDDVSTILDAATESGARVLVLVQNEWFRAPGIEGYGDDLDEQRATFDEVMVAEAEERGAEVVDLRDLYAQEADDELWVDDGIHPTPESYEAWATEIAARAPVAC